MSVVYESPTSRSQAKEAYFTPGIAGDDIGGSHNQSGSATPYFTAPIDQQLHQEFLNAIHARHAAQPFLQISAPPSNLGSPKSRSSSILQPVEARHLSTALENDAGRTMVLDVRSFVQYSQARIRSSINVSIPNTILKRPTFTMNKVYEAVVLESDRQRLKKWQSMKTIVIYDQSSQMVQDNCAATYLANKLSTAGFTGDLYYLEGGFDAFSSAYPNQCEKTQPEPQNRVVGGGGRSLPPHLPPAQPTANPCLPQGRNAAKPFSLKLPPMTVSNPVSGPFTAPMPQFENEAFNPFFSNIRQNMELSHGPIRERFSVRLPHNCKCTGAGVVQLQQGAKAPRCLRGTSHLEQNGAFVAPKWMRDVVQESGPKKLAEMYEKLERKEQRRLHSILHYHSKYTNVDPSEYPLSIVSGIEMGTLNRYTNIWPFEYARVKIAHPKSGSTDYINASFIQYQDGDEQDVAIDTHVSKVSLETMRYPDRSRYRRYISTQGPLPDTFADFWQVVWEQNSRVVVMLTKQEEMNKIKCHQYWPNIVNAPVRYGNITVTLLSETVRGTGDDSITIRQLVLAVDDRQQPRRSITQLQYNGWMDFGVPDTPLGTLQIVKAADEAQVLYESQEENTVGPMVVHCSAGCGRSGAFCAIDTIIRRLSESKEYGDEQDLIFETISRFREQRVSMVQTLRQFVFCYEAIWWWLLGYGDMPTQPGV